jgi:C-terminal processing protease CtpA/Prc
MKKYILTVLISVSTISVICQTNTNDSKFNLDFEKVSNPQQLPDGWGRWGHPSFSLIIDSVTKNSGKYSLRIESQSDDIANGEFGCPRYSIPAIYEGNTISVKAFMKLEEVENPIGLLLRIDGNAGSLQFNNMQQMGIKGTLDWKEYSVTLPLPREAETIHIGAIHSGKGKLWVDDFQLLIDGKDITEAKIIEKVLLPADKDKEFDNGSAIVFPSINEQLINNLNLLGKLWGFLKYHHPEVGKGNYNWDYELFRILPAYLKVRNTAERDKTLLDWINKYGTIPVCATCKATPADAYLKPNLSWAEKSDMNNDLKKKVQGIYTNRHQGEHYYIKMFPNVGNPDFTNEKPYINMPYPDAGFRLLALYKYWNMIQYFFPSTYMTDKNWDNVLKEYIPKFISANNELEYELAAIQIIGEINDTHAAYLGGGDKIQSLRGNNFASFRVQFVEQKLVVTDYYNPELKDASGLEVGDIITHINGKTVESIIDSVKIYYPASNEAARLRDIADDLLRSNSNTINLRYISSGQVKQKELPLYQRSSLSMYRWYKVNQHEKCYKLLDGNIGYVTLANIKNEDIPEIKQLFKNTKGIIIDIRNYPSAFTPFTLAPYFVSNSTPFVKFTQGNLNNPGEFTFRAGQNVPKDNETYQGKLVVIVNEITQSSAEYQSMAFKAGDNTTIIGSTTAGADGNVSQIVLPGGLRTMISGIGVYYPDGTPTQRVGIVPDIWVEPTINGIKQGRDELLEKAIEIINYDR